MAELLSHTAMACGRCVVFDPFISTEAWLLILLVVIGFASVQAGARYVQPRFDAKPLLNKSEQRLYHVLADLIGHEHYLLSQVSFGEILSCKSRKKYFSMHAKRADFVICDRQFKAVAVVEYHGRGHFGRTRASRDKALDRDRQKARALAEAGVPLIEIPAQFDRRLIEGRLHAVLAPDLPSECGRSARQGRRSRAAPSRPPAASHVARDA